MAKEKTTLINMRIPNSILEKFDHMVDSDPLIPSRTAKIVGMMDSEVKKAERINKR